MLRNSVTVLISLSVIVTTTGMTPGTVSGFPSAVLSVIPDFNSIDLGILIFMNVPHTAQYSLYQLSLWFLLQLGLGRLSVDPMFVILVKHWICGKNHGQHVSCQGFKSGAQAIVFPGERLTWITRSDLSML